MTDITLTSEQEDKVVNDWLLWVIHNDCGSEDTEDKEHWKQAQEAAKVLLWPLKYD